MHRYRVIVVGAAGLLSLAIARPARAQEPRRVTLSEALELALRSQPAMVQARQDVRVADAQERQTVAAYLPSLSASGNTSKSSSTRIDATTGLPVTTLSQYSSQLGFSANWDLFTGLRRGSQHSAANATTDQREATLRRQEYTIVLSTKQTFFQALAFHELVNVQQTRLRRADEQLKLTSERLRLGATTRSDSLRARVEYGNAQLALINAQNNLRNAQASLGRVIQVEGLVMAAYDSALEVRLPPLDTATLMREALAAAPSVREADAAVAVTRATKNASRATYFPVISLGGGYNFAASDQIIAGGQYLPTWNFRLNFSYPLFNNLTRETSMVTADANVQSSLARARDSRLAVSTGLTQYIAALDAAAAKIDVSLVSVAASEEDLRMQRERYRLGAVTIIEVLTSQGNLDQAQVDLVQSRYDYLVARAQIEAVVGHAL
jgi:outer membrane protein TolC